MDIADLPNEIDVVRDVSERLAEAGIPFMLTGSMAMNYYAEPRMTRDIDVVLELEPGDADHLASVFEDAYYVDRSAVADAIRHRSSFNLIHREGIIKVDCFPRKAGPFREVEFQRRQQIVLGDAPTYIVTREDLILAKLQWARESLSEMQLRDIRNLMAASFDEAYVVSWVERLDLGEIWRKARP